MIEINYTKRDLLALQSIIRAYINEHTGVVSPRRMHAIKRQLRLVNEALEKFQNASLLEKDED